ncbi:MAG: amidohydrolase family protein [Acidimicrobiia bacterium]
MRGGPHTRVLVAMLVVVTACSAGTTDSTTTTHFDPAPTTTTTPIDATPGSAPGLILHNAQVVTVDESFTITEAIAISDGDIVAVGTSEDLMALAGPKTLVIDVGGRTVMPGFVDPHTHHLQNPAPNLDGMRDGIAFMLKGGTTTSGAPAVIPDELEAYRSLDAAGELPVRTHLYLSYNDFCDGRDHGDFYLENEFSQDPDLRLAVAGVKMFSDGGACRAPAISHEYLDTTPDHLKEVGWVGSGDLYVTADEVASVVSEVDAAGGITVIHGIGDLGLREAINGLAIAYERRPFAQHQRIDHNSLATLLTPDELSIYGDIGMVPVVFGVRWAGACDPTVGEAWKSILSPPVLGVIENSTALRAANPGMRLSWHGDAPSIPGQPFQLMFSFVTDGAVDVDTGEPCYPTAWQGVPTVDLEEALRMMTVNAAAAMGIEERVGSLEVGKVADLLILTEDPFDPDPEVGIAANRPLVTIIDGEVVYCEGALCDQFGFAGKPEQPDEPPPDVPEGWEPVDHPVVVAVQASASIQPPSWAVDGSEDTSWVSGQDAPQWIELDLGTPTDVELIRLMVDQAPAGLTVHEIYAGAHEDPGRFITTIEGDTDYGDRLEAAIGITVRYIRILTTTSPSWVAWIEIEVVPAG